MRAGRRRHRIEIDQRLAHRFARERMRAAVGEQFAITVASAAAGRSLIRGGRSARRSRSRSGAPADARRPRACRRPRRPAPYRASADKADDRPALMRGSSARQNLSTSRKSVIFSSFGSDSTGSMRRVQRLRVRARPAHGRRCDPPDCAIARARLRRGQQLRQHDLVGIGETGFLAAHRAHADALLDRMVAFLDDAVFEHPRLAARVLEIQIGRVDGRTDQLREHAIQVAAARPPGLSRRCSARASKVMKVLQNKRVQER